jgi:dUTP pyrophosphatase
MQYGLFHRTIKIAPDAKELEPSYASMGDAGADLRSAIDTVLKPNERKLIPTGVKIELPTPEFVGLVCPRSGLALKHGITVLNAPGIIDSGYRGEIGVILWNTGDEDFEIKRGDRIAQLVITVASHASFVPFANLLPSGTERGELGFGSTGLK